MSLNELNQEANNQTNNNQTCKTLNNKSACIFRNLCMGCCKRYNRNYKNVLQLGIGSSDAAAGSDGPRFVFLLKDGKINTLGRILLFRRKVILKIKKAGIVRQREKTAHIKINLKLI